MTKYVLAHHGIKGQRWGVRKYQNEDGSLTAAGKAKYGTGNYSDQYDRKANDTLTKDYREADAKAAEAVLDGTSKSIKAISKVADDIGTNKSGKTKAPTYNELSDTELRNRINRMNMERNYGELTGDVKKVRTGRDWTREVLQTTGAAVAIVGSIAGIALSVNSIRLDKKAKS